jgi:hypothetical protein
MLDTLMMERLAEPLTKRRFCMRHVVLVTATLVWVAILAPVLLKASGLIDNSPPANWVLCQAYLSSLPGYEPIPEFDRVCAKFHV